jgi:hypothetical protein
LVYAAVDPFMVIHKYSDFNRKAFIPKNRDYVSSEVYLINRGKENYDSYIFGSSTALFVRPSIWKTYLDDSAKVFSFDASRENIAGIWSKIRFIDHNKGRIRNVVFILDYNYAFDRLDRENVLFVKHPGIFHSSWYDFQYKNFLRIFDLNFMHSLAAYSITGEFKPYMADFLLNERSVIDPVTNEYTNFSIQEELDNDSTGYYEIRKERFPVRAGQPCEYRPQITEKQRKMLVEIKNIFDKDATDYRIIIAPNYQQVSLNSTDLETLRTVFGEENVIDFSGINSISEEKSNFYDGLHFKPYVGKQMLDIAYRTKAEI